MIRQPLSPSALALALALALAPGCARDDAIGRGAEAGRPPAAPPPPAEQGTDPQATGPRDPLVERILVVALDGATWRVVDPLLAAGRMPNLADILARGVRADLATLEPTVSPAIWTTIATGALPRHHGILGFEGVPGATMRTLPNSRMRKRKAYWEILPDYGRTTGTIGWWATWPADPMPEGSWLVSDRVPYTRMEAAIDRTTGLAPDDVWPRDLLQVVEPLVERPDDLDPAVAREFLGMGPEEMRTKLIGTRYEMGSYLPEFRYVYQSDLTTRNLALDRLRRQPVDVESVYFTGIDTVSHLFWHFTWPEEFPNETIDPDDIRRYGGVIPKYCERVDEWIGELVRAAGPDATVIVVSDHGFGPTGRLPWSGGHGRLTPGAPIAPAGLLAMAGPGIAPGPARLERAHVLDVAPTLLHLMGVPAGRDMPGRVLVEALDPSLPPELPRVATLETVGRLRQPAEIPVDPAGDAERRERLRALGYVQ